MGGDSIYIYIYICIYTRIYTYTPILARMGTQHTKTFFPVVEVRSGHGRFSRCAALRMLA